MKFLIKDSPCYVGLNKDEPKLLAKVNEIIAKAKADGEIAEAFGEMAEAAVAARILRAARSAGRRGASP